MYSKIRIAFYIIMAFLLVSGCRSAYYAAWEKLGKEKRHLLKDQVEKVRTDQKETSEQFQDVLTLMKQMYSFDGGELEKFYNRLKSEYETCRERAEGLRERIDKVRQVGSDLFSEWENEIEQIENPNLRSKSKRSLRETKRRFARLENSLVRSENSMEPVLQNFQDYVLYLKHNLNARAIGALKNEVSDIESDVNRLITDMNASVREAEEFLRDFE